MLARTSNKRQQRSKTTSIPAPVGGLNAKDSIAKMPATDALILDNVFCSPTSVDVRGGSSSWATGMTGWIETLAHWNGPTSKKLFAAVGTKVYNVTSSGAVGAAALSGLTNARFQTTNIGTPGGQFLVMVNGADKLRGYNGSAWWTDGDGAHDITGVNSALLIHTNLHKNRLWFVEKDSMRAWYLPTQSIAGAAQSIDFGSLFRLGGYLMAMSSWTIDNSGGMDDYAAFITSEGEVAIYRGYDPNLASSWALVGIFRMGKPIGRRCFARVGSDVLLINADGVMPLSKALLTDRSQQEDAVSYKIVNMINSDVQSYGSNFGWQIILYPIGNKLIINVPQTENSAIYQYVMNTITGAWSTWGKYTSPLNAACWELLGDKIYFGGNGVVYQGDTAANSDSDVAITWDAKPAFSYFKELGSEKLFQMARPVFLSDAAFQVAVVLDVDFSESQPSAVTAYSGSIPLWDSSPWDTTPWLAGLYPRKDWLGVQGLGYAASLHIRGSTRNMTVKLQSIDYLYEYGGVL